MHFVAALIHIMLKHLNIDYGRKSTLGNKYACEFCVTHLRHIVILTKLLLYPEFKVSECITLKKEKKIFIFKFTSIYSTKSHGKVVKHRHLYVIQNNRCISES